MLIRYVNVLPTLSELCVCPLINGTYHKFSVLNNHPFYVQHCCSYLTENMVLVNLKKTKDFKIFKGKSVPGVRIMRNTPPLGKVQRLRMLQ
jgi:hypothetical protein